MPPSHKTTADIELGLLALAAAGGNAHEAKRHLDLVEPPVRIGLGALNAWKIKYADRYSEIVADRAPLIEGIVLEQVRETILQAGKLQTRVLTQLLAAVEAGELEPKELSTVLKSAGVSLGINVEKMLLLTNRPTVIAEKRDVAELIQSLARRVPGLIVGEAEEITTGDPDGSPVSGR